MASSSSGFKRPYEYPLADHIPDLSKESKSYCTRQSNKLFMSVVKNLSPEQREAISAVGFGHLLELGCSFTPKALVSWIIKNFDSSSNSIVFSNGSNFPLSSAIVHKVLGLPYGGTKIDKKALPHASAFIKRETNCVADTPTIKELVTLISPQLSGPTFVRTFLLFTLSTFLCPTTHRQASPRYFGPLLEVDKIASYDWSLLVFEWLIDYIRRYQSRIAEGKSCALGGCTFLLVIFILMLNLDCQPGSTQKYGRLPVKDLCMTPFVQPVVSIHGDEVVNHICFDESISEIRESTRRKLSNLSHKLQLSVFEAIKPVVASYAAQYVRILKDEQTFAYKHGLSSPSPIQNHNVDVGHMFHCEPDETEAALGNFSESDDDEFLVSHNVDSKLSSLSSDDKDPSPLFAQTCFFPPIIKDVVSNPLHIDPFTHMLSKLSYMSVGDCSLDLQIAYPYNSIEEYLSSLVRPIEVFSVPEEDALSSLSSMISFCSEHDKIAGVNAAQVHEDHVDMSFLNISHQNKNSSEVKGSLQSTCLVSSDNLQQSTSCKLSKPLSLNDHFQKSHSNMKVKQVSGHPIVDPHSSFDLITADCDPPPLKSSRDDNQSGNMSQNDALNNDILVQTIDPSLEQAYEDCAIQAEYQYQERLMNHLCAGFNSCRDMIEHEANSATFRVDKLKSYTPSIPIIFAKEAEKLFYNVFTSNVMKTGPSDHIFQVNNCWVDRRTLALSMKTGCWLNKFVMDAFCAMFNHEQEERLKLRNPFDGEITNFFFAHQIADLLMKPSLIHNDFADELRAYKLGIVLEKVDYVYIPCCLNYQWFVVVVNFANKSFDVLSSEPGFTTCRNVINTIVYNFKCLFVLSYRHCVRFNIRDFEPRYVDVPKQQFRYDSGIFALRFLQTFDGTEVEKFSNVDLIALRQKLLFQLLSYKFNKFNNKFADLLLAL
ncbi:hypothetical protein ACP70R_008659 [Stipagrostis hirtigluma subsp. patula]